MAFSHPTRHLPSQGRELFIVLIAIFLMLVSLLIINLIGRLPQERAVPQPIVAGSSIPVHFSKLQGSQSRTETTLRTLPSASQSAPLKAALAQLLAEPTQQEKANGFYSEIPQGTELLGLNHQSGSVTVNLSRQFMTGGRATSVIQRMAELKDTIYGVEGETDIHIAIEGKPLVVLSGEGLEIN